VNRSQGGAGNSQGIDERQYVPQGTVTWTPGNPAIPKTHALRTGGFASPPYDGFAITTNAAEYPRPAPARQTDARENVNWMALGLGPECASPERRFGIHYIDNR